MTVITDREIGIDSASRASFSLMRTIVVDAMLLQTTHLKHGFDYSLSTRERLAALADWAKLVDASFKEVDRGDLSKIGEDIDRTVELGTIRILNHITSNNQLRDAWLESSPSEKTIFRDALERMIRERYNTAIQSPSHEVLGG